MGKRWTVVDLDRLYDAYVGGMSDAEIGVLLSRSEAAITKQRSVMGLTRGSARPWSVAATSERKETSMGKPRTVVTGNTETGRLWSVGSGGRYYFEGEWHAPDGKVIRRKFGEKKAHAAKAAFRAWRKEMDAAAVGARKRAAKDVVAKVSMPETNASAPVNVPERPQEATERPIASNRDQVPEEESMTQEKAEKRAPDKIWLLQTKSGKAVAYFTDEVTALAVADGLEKGAEASGFTATYNIEQVGAWGV